MKALLLVLALASLPAFAVPGHAHHVMDGLEEKLHSHCTRVCTQIPCIPPQGPTCPPPVRDALDKVLP